MSTTTQVQNLLHMAQQDPNLQAMTTNATKDNVMNRPTTQIHQWIETVMLHLCHHLAAAQQRAILQTRDIQSYFQTMNIYYQHNYKPP